jgi:hypothetical protein
MMKSKLDEETNMSLIANFVVWITLAGLIGVGIAMIFNPL